MIKLKLKLNPNKLKILSELNPRLGVFLPLSAKVLRERSCIFPVIFRKEINSLVNLGCVFTSGDNLYRISDRGIDIMEANHKLQPLPDGKQKELFQ